MDFFSACVAPALLETGGRHRSLFRWRTGGCGGLAGPSRCAGVSTRSALEAKLPDPSLRRAFCRLVLFARRRLVSSLVSVALSCWIAFCSAASASSTDSVLLSDPSSFVAFVGILLPEGRGAIACCSPSRTARPAEARAGIMRGPLLRTMLVSAWSPIPLRLTSCWAGWNSRGPFASPHAVSFGVVRPSLARADM